VIFRADKDITMSVLKCRIKVQGKQLQNGFQIIGWPQFACTKYWTQANKNIGKYSGKYQRP